MFSKFPALYRNMELYFIRTPCTETQNQLPKKCIEMLGEAMGSRGAVPVFSYFTDAVESLVMQQAPKRYYQLICSYYYIYTNFAKDINKRLVKLQVNPSLIYTLKKISNCVRTSFQHSMALTNWPLRTTL